MNHGADRALVAAMLEGDEAAFRRFFDHYFSRLYRFALRRVGRDAEAASEVVQLTLIRAIHGLEGFRAEAALFTWLCQICRYQAVDYLRTHQRHEHRIEWIDASPQQRAAFERTQAPAADEPEHSCVTAQRRQLVQSVLKTLPARYANVLKWKYLEERSVGEISELLGCIGHSAAQSVLARARHAFREALATARQLAA